MLVPLDTGGAGVANRTVSFKEFLDDYTSQELNDGYQFGDGIKSLGHFIRALGIGAGHIGDAQGLSDYVQSEFPHLYSDEAQNEFINNVSQSVGSNPSLSDAKTIGDLSGKSVEEQLEYLIQNDPQNSTAWREQLLGLLGERENVNDARAYELYMDSTRAQRTAKDLEVAGINPLLAYQYMSGTRGSVGTAGYPDVGVATNATSRENSIRSEQAADKRTNASILAAVIALVGIYLKKML